MFSERIELLDGYIRCNQLFLIIDIALIFHFCVTWYMKYKRTGLKVSYWHLFMFRNFFIQFLLLYPFNSSIKNFVSFGTNIFAADKFMDLAFIVTCTGYVSIIVGSWLAQFGKSFVLNLSPIHTFETFIEKNIKSKTATNILIAVSLLFLFYMLTHTLGTRYLFNPRNYFIGNKDIRPIYSLLLNLYPLTVIFTGLRMIQLKDNNSSYSFFIVITLSIFLGTRISIIEPLMILVFFYFIKNNEKVSFNKIILVLASFLTLLLLIAAFRQGKSENALTEILYGNHFSDTRDFAFLLAYFKDSWLNGKSYLAGFMTFIPRQYSEFRANWAFGLYCSHLVGIYSPLFPGHRPGYFGDIYMNFRIYGVIILGIWTGFVVTHIDNKILKEFNNGKDVIKMYSYTFVAFFATTLSISLISTQLYTVITVIILLALMRHLISYGYYFYYGKK